MKILRNIVLFALPFIIIINLYRFIFVGDNSTFGFQSFMDYFQTFNGWQSTLTVIYDMKTYVNEFVDAYQNVNAWEYIVAFFEMVGAVFRIPIAILTDIVGVVVWVVQFITGTN